MAESGRVVRRFGREKIRSSATQTLLLNGRKEEKMNMYSGKHKIGKMKIYKVDLPGDLCQRSGIGQLISSRSTFSRGPSTTNGGFNLFFRAHFPIGSVAQRMLTSRSKSTVPLAMQNTFGLETGFWTTSVSSAMRLTHFSAAITGASHRCSARLIGDEGSDS